MVNIAGFITYFGHLVVGMKSPKSAVLCLFFMVSSKMFFGNFVIFGNFDFDSMIPYPNLSIFFNLISCLVFD